jgi:predicted permease
MNDLRYAARQFGRRPGFTATAVLTLALGIGATTALYTVVRSIVLSPLPYDTPEALVALNSPVPRLAPEAVWGLSEAGYFFLRGESRTITELGAYTTSRLNLSGDHGASRVAAALVSRSLLDVVRARPALGRFFTADEDRPGGPAVAVLGYDFWRRAFGADASVIGSTVQIQSVSREVIGVMAPDLHLPDHPVDVWLPLQLDPLRAPVNAHWIGAIGRLEAGVTPDVAQDELTRLTARLPEVLPQAYYPGFMERYGFTTRVRPLRDEVLGDIGRTLVILLAAVSLVLVIAAVNVANLFMIRTELRRGELAVRTALGASRAALLRQGLAEGLLTAFAAGAVGVALADAGVRLLLVLSPPDLPRLREVGMGWNSLVFAVVVSVGAGVAVGVLPLLRARLSFAALRSAATPLSASGQHAARRTLVVTQIAMALVLLAAAGLMFRSLDRLRAVRPGIEPAQATTFELNLPAARYQDYDAVLRFYRTLIERVEALPGVVAAAGGPVPLQDFGGCALVFVEDQPVVEDERPRCVNVQLTTPGYFRTLGTPLRGRAPAWSETEAGAAGAVVTTALARRLWPGEDPIGKGIRGNGWAQPFYRVVGVTGELRANGLDEPPTEAVFFPMKPVPGAPLWSPPRSLALIVRTSGANPAELAGSIRRAVSALDPTVPLDGVASLEQVVARSMARRSLVMLLLGVAGSMALVLSVVGLYGVVAYVVSRRTAEIGLRMALGAQARSVAVLVVRDALLLCAAGVALGLAGAFASTRALRALLFDVSPTDGLTFVAVTLLLLVVTACASALPARRAARTAPMAALRHE